MAKAPKEPIVSLSIRLMREGKVVDECIRDNKLQEVDCKEPEGARLFTATSINDPTWIKYIRRMTDAPVEMSNRSSAAVLFIDVPVDGAANRLCALTFGTGHHAIDPEAVESDFGLRVVLNSIPRGEISSIDSATPDSTTFQRRVQASRNSDISAFGVDVERDLLRVAAGKPKDAKFAEFAAGRDSLTIQCRVSPKDIPEKLRECIRLSFAKTYLDDFDWVDNIRPTKDRITLQKLDDLVAAEIKSIKEGGLSDLHMSPPEIYDYTEGRLIAYYGPGLSVGKNWYPRLDISDYVNELSESKFDGDLDDLRAHKVHVHVDAEAESQTKWSVFECLVWDVELDGETYVAFGGKWYQINKNFAAGVEADLAKRMKVPSFIATTKAKNEKEFIEELTALPEYINLDQTKLSPGGVKAANIEFSDFLSKDRLILHLKDGHSSSAISHLWSQGLVCGDALTSDQEFRKRLRAAVRKREKDQGKADFVDLLPVGPARVDTTKYTIAYGILRRRHAKSKKLGLPFFSKVSMRPVAKQLERLGYKVELHLVEKLP